MKIGTRSAVIRGKRSQCMIEGIRLSFGEIGKCYPYLERKHKRATKCDYISKCMQNDPTMESIHPSGFDMGTRLSPISSEEHKVSMWVTPYVNFAGGIEINKGPKLWLAYQNCNGFNRGTVLIRDIRFLFRVEIGVSRATFIQWRQIALIYY